MEDISPFIPSLEQIRNGQQPPEKSFDTPGIEGAPFIEMPRGVEGVKESFLAYSVQELSASIIGRINSLLNLAFLKPDLIKDMGKMRRYTLSLRTPNGMLLSDEQYETLDASFSDDKTRREYHRNYTSVNVAMSLEEIFSHQSPGVARRFFYFQRYLSEEQSVLILKKILEYYSQLGWKVEGPDEKGNVTFSTYPFRDESILLINNPSA